jgi:hypothetical protein
MSYSKSIAIVLTTFVCATALAVDAGAQSRGRSGGRSSGGRGPSAGSAAPRTSSPRNGAARVQPYRGDGRYDNRGYSPRLAVRAPLRSYYYPYSYYGYGYRPGFSLGLSFGYPYPYGYYGYGYPYGYGYSYGGYYPVGYAGYGYGGYAPRYDAYGGIRIQGAPRNAEVYVDGGYAGIVDDYDGVFQRLDLEPGSHEIEIRSASRPIVYDVNVTPGQTVTIHANVR